MKLLTLLWLAATGIHSAHALEVVKVFSQNPSGARTLVGSGVLLQGYPFLITSDHVFFHSNNGYLHERSGGDVIPKISLGDFLVADWGKGLGLFKSSSLDPLYHQDNGFCEKEHPAKTRFEGFPSASDDQVSIESKFSERISAEDYFVQNKFLDVYQGGLAEFGMSGGAVIDPDNHCLAGIISHQRKNAKGEMETLVIPSSEIKEWYEAKVKSYEDGDYERRLDYRKRWIDRQSTFFEEVSSQLGPQKSVVMHRIRYYLYPIAHPASGPQMMDVLATVDDRVHPGETTVIPTSFVINTEKMIAVGSPEAAAIQANLRKTGVHSIAVARDRIYTVPRVENPPSIWMVPVHETVTDLEFDDGLGKMKKLLKEFNENCSYAVDKDKRQVLRIKGWSVNGSPQLQALESPGLVRFFRDLKKSGLEPVSEFPIQSRTDLF